MPEAATSEAAQQSPSGRSERGGAVRDGRRSERGGAVSLWVLLMVPVSAFAAVVAMAGPQRLAAESSVQEAADDLAMFTVAWRDGHRLPEGQLPAFFERCDETSAAQQDESERLGTELLELTNNQGDDPPGLGLPPDDQQVIDKQAEIRRHAEDVEKWSKNCEQLFNALLRDLGYLGVDMGSLQGLYSDSLTQTPLTTWVCSDPTHTTEPACTSAGETWAPTNPRYAVPCRTTEAIAGHQQAMVVRDAVYVALAAHWQDAGWAAAQVWPDGLPMAGASMGRLAQRDPSATPPMCGDQLKVTDSQGRPMPDGHGRELVQSVPRTALSG